MIGLSSHDYRWSWLGAALQRVGLGLLLALLAWAPLPVGSNRPWSKELLVVAAATIVSLGMSGLLLQGRQVLVPRRLGVAGLLLVGVLLWAWLQACTGLPAAWAHPLWAQVAGTGIEAAPSVSLDPAATKTGLLLLAGYGLLFAYAFVVGQQSRPARVLAAGLVGIASGWAVWGIVRFIGGMELLFYPGMVTTPGVSANFPNRSHFATYANLAVLLVAARLGSQLLRSGLGKLRLRTAAGEAARYLFEEKALWLGAGVLLLAASLGSTSRGGFLSLSVAFTFLLAVMAQRVATGAIRAGLALMVVAGLVVALVPVAGTVLIERLSQLDLDYVRGDIEGPGRLAAWQVALGLVSERPWLGHGYGVFGSAFLLRADERFTIFYDYAHNSYLETAVELGLPATGALLVAIALAASLCFKRDRHGQARSLPLAAAAGTVLVALHSLVDFSIQIPAVAASYAVLLGLGCGQAVAQAAPEQSRRPDREAVARADEQPEPAGAWSNARDQAKVDQSSSRLRTAGILPVPFLRIGRSR